MGGNDSLVIIDGVTSDVATLTTIVSRRYRELYSTEECQRNGTLCFPWCFGRYPGKDQKGTGKGFQISYEGNYGIEAMYKSMEMLDANKYIAAAQKYGLEYNNKGYDTNFRKAITRTGNIQNHYLAFSGGTPQSNYRASFGYIDHNTIIRSKGYRNLVAKIDVTQKAFGDKLTGDFGVFGSSFQEQ